MSDEERRSSLAEMTVDDLLDSWPSSIRGELLSRARERGTSVSQYVRQYYVSQAGDGNKKSRSDDRHDTVVAMKAGGASNASIAEAVGLTKQRVGQIVRAAGMSDFGTYEGDATTSCGGRRRVSLGAAPVKEPLPIIADWAATTSDYQIGAECAKLLDFYREGRWTSSTQSGALLPGLNVEQWLERARDQDPAYGDLSKDDSAIFQTCRTDFRKARDREQRQSR